MVVLGLIYNVRVMITLSSLYIVSKYKKARFRYCDIASASKYEC